MTTVLVAALGVSANSYAASQEGLQFELTPYAWLSGIDGEVTAGSREVDFDQSFSDIVDNVDAALMGLGVVSYNRFVLLGQYDYVELGADGGVTSDSGIGALPPGTSVDGNLEQQIGTFAGGYRFDTFGEHNTIDVLVGVRNMSLETELRALSSQRESDVDIDDTIVMLRPSFRLSENWRLNPTFAYGISGDSDTHYELSPQLQWQFADSFALRFGYRTLHYEESSDSGVNEIDVDFSGLFVGVGWTFPTRTEPVAVAAPAPQAAPARPPAPAVATAPKDSDGDGVPDPQDQCPDTPRGTRVGPYGCDCDVSIQLQFKFDSAELTDADKAALDQAAAQLTQLRFVSGVATGYADSVGDESYNMGLSERRAQSAVDYLASKGVVSSRLTVAGLGEADPVADNSTEEGRAQNRRVVIRRTDCGG